LKTHSITFIILSKFYLWHFGFCLPGDVDPDKVEASCKNGVLTVTLPKSEKAKAVKIKVKGQ